MIYTVVSAKIGSDGVLTLGRRREKIVWSAPLRVGGLYFLRQGRLYKVVSEG